MQRAISNPTSHKFAQYYALTKPRVTQLAVFCAVIGMFLAAPLGQLPEWQTILAATLGIGLLASAAFAVNCILEQHIDARMARTRARPLPQGMITDVEALLFSALIGTLGALILYIWVNTLTLWLTFATFIGYAVIYTVILKPATPQNIVIGGLSGAMPPALGWAAVANAVPVQAWILVFIIFIWTPPHFWALALYRHKDYQNADLPMLPVTHGIKFTQLHILLYSIALLGASLLPYAIHMSGLLYLGIALILGTLFVLYAWKIYSQYSDELARRMFRFSILYLSCLFAALLIDHYLRY